MRVTPDGEAIAGQTLRYRQRRFPRLFSAPSRRMLAEPLRQETTQHTQHTQLSTVNVV